jgi:GTPase SAR1 family protein
VGTEIDLRENPKTLEMMRDQEKSPITREQGRQLAREIGAAAYVEARFQFTEKNVSSSQSILYLQLI